ncbi:MAG: hypothetical protein JNL04_12415 [Rhodospirillaceae bacterium]|nr:hypothetical protein [Rhodospirillaceae bacterium]
MTGVPAGGCTADGAAAIPEVRLAAPAVKDRLFRAAVLRPALLLAAAEPEMPVVLEPLLLALPELLAPRPWPKPATFEERSLSLPS